MLFEACLIVPMKRKYKVKRLADMMLTINEIKRRLIACVLIISTGILLVILGAFLVMCSKSDTHGLVCACLGAMTMFGGMAAYQYVIQQR